MADSAPPVARAKAYSEGSAIREPPGKVQPQSQSSRTIKESNMSRTLTASLPTHSRVAGMPPLRKLVRVLRSIGADYVFALRAATEAELYRRRQAELRALYTGAKRTIAR